MINIRHIYEGWKNYFVKNPVVESVARDRAKICSGCEYAGKVLGVNTCNACGCPLSFKTRSMDASCEHPVKEQWSSLKKKDGEE